MEKPKRKIRDESITLQPSTDATPIYHDLDELVGTWVEDEDFDAAIAEQDRIDDELWR